MSLPDPGRVAELRVLVWEAALRHLERFGSPLPADAAALALADALAAPHVAVRCPRLRQRAGPEARLPSSASAPEAFVATLGLPGASSGWCDVQEAARLLGVSARRVRQLCQAGRLLSRPGPDGRWRVERGSAAAYARRRADASRERATA